MRTFGNGIVLKFNNGVKRHKSRTLKRGSKHSCGNSSQDSDHCDSVPTTKADGTNDVSGVMTTITSPSSPEYLIPFATGPPWSYFPPTVVDDDDDDGDGGAEWVRVDEFTDPNPNPLSLYDGYVFGSAPSVDEVQAALASLQGFLDQATFANGVKESDCDSEEGTGDQSDSTTDSSSVTPVGSISDWIEPSMQLCYSNMPDKLQPRRGYGRVYDVLYMLQNEPMVQKMVTSLSSDNAVWDAVLNNTVVREIRETLGKAVVNSSVSLVNSSVSSKASDSKSGNFLGSFVAGLKAKIEGLINSLRMVIISLIHLGGTDKATRESGDATDVRLRVSFMLTMIVFLAIVLKRMNKA